MPTSAVTFGPGELTIVSMLLLALSGAVVYLHKMALSLAAERAVAERERAIRAERINDGILPVLERQSDQIERLIDQTEKLTDIIRTRS